jgi:ribosomal protein S15P/S13E
LSRRIRVFFDQTQNERGRLDTTYSTLGNLLTDNDFDAEPYTEFMILAKKIKDAEVLVFGCPNSSKLRPAEIDVLTHYVKAGGGLFLLSLSGGDRGLMNNLSKLSKTFGIEFDNTAVKDERNNAGLPTMPFVSNLIANPCTEDVQDLLYPSGCSLKVSGSAVVLASSSEMADPANQPVIAAAEYGKGRVICSGSYEIFRKGGGLKHAGNKTFAINAIKWLSGDVRLAKPSKVAKAKSKKGTPATEASPAKLDELEGTLRRLVNAVFDLQKDIEKVGEQVRGVDGNVEMLRNQFQDFAEKTQQQLGVMIPTKQFKTLEENQEVDLRADIKALQQEVKSIQQLKDHVDQRHSSGKMANETYDEQVKKLDTRLQNLKKHLKVKKKELKDLGQ